MKGKKEINVPLNMSQNQIKKWINGIKQLLEECEDSAGKKTLKGFIKDYEEALEKRRKFDLEAKREGNVIYYSAHREEIAEKNRQWYENNKEKRREINRRYRLKQKEKKKKERCDSC